MTGNPYKINTPGRVVRRAPEPEKAEPEKAEPEKAAPRSRRRSHEPEKCSNCGRELEHGYTHVKREQRLVDGEVVIRCDIVSDTDGDMYAGGRLQNRRVRFVTGRGRD